METETPPAVPTWVKVLAGILAIALAAVLALHWMGRMALHH